MIMAITVVKETAERRSTHQLPQPHHLPLHQRRLAPRSLRLDNDSTHFGNESEPSKTEAALPMPCRAAWLQKRRRQSVLTQLEANPTRSLHGDG